MLVAALLVSIGAMTISAQENCNKNSSISHEAVKANNFADAYLPWKEVMKECPTLKFYTYADGFKILKGFMDQDNQANNNARTSAEYKQYFDELMAAHDQRMQYIPHFQTIMKNVPSVMDALGTKSLDYIAYVPAESMDLDLVYSWLSQSANELKSEASPNTLHYYLEMSLNKLKQDPEHREQFIQDYLNVSQYADEALANAEKESEIQNMQIVKDNSVALFINSGAADCESLQEIYGPKVEENKTDMEYLRKVINIMRMVRCTEEEAYFQAAYYCYQIEPTPDAAAGCAAMAYKKGNMDSAMKFYEEALNLEPDNLKKADYAISVASMLYKDKKYAQSKNYALKAISYNDRMGTPHLLLAHLYASSPRWSEEDVLNKCTYFVVIDRLQRAKALDPSLADEANKSIATYSQYTPTPSDLFMLGYKVGDRITVGGWINETTTIR